MTRCKKHRYDYGSWCWFCFCEYQNKPYDFGGFEPEVLEEFMKKHPEGKVGK